MNSIEKLDRYRPFIDNFGDFLDASFAPLPVSLWRNEPRCSDADFKKWFAGETAIVESEWAPGTFRVESFDSLSFLSAYLCGLVHAQEEIGMLPVLMLGASDGDRVLDVCAAPGNKMAALSVQVGSTGTVVGNDISSNRLGVARLTIDRLGLYNVALTSLDGASLPGSIGLFDRVLVDVPCSCEGTTRKQPRVLDRSDHGFRERLIVRQRSILKKALELCRPGGRVVYSTCTYAPEECEMVVAHVLDTAKVGSQYKISRVFMPGLSFSEGLTSWEGKSLRDDLKNAIRIYPQQNDTGGFFAVALDREDVADPETDDGFPGDLDEGDDPMVLLGSELTKLKIDGDPLRDMLLARDSNKYFSLYNRHMQVSSNAPVLSRGVKAINMKGQAPRVSTAGCLLLGAACADPYELDDTELIQFLRRIPLTARLTSTINPGPLLLFYRGKPVGRGGLRQAADTWLLESHYPKSIAGMDVQKRLDNLLL